MPSSHHYYQNLRPPVPDYCSRVLPSAEHEHSACSLPGSTSCPLLNNVALCPPRGECIMPVRLHAPVCGSYNSAVAREVLVVPRPPTTSTWPLFSKVAVWALRASCRLPVALHMFVLGLY